MCGETRIEGAKEPKVEFVKQPVRVPEYELDEERVERLSRIITDNWEMRCRLGLQSDLDVAAIVLTRMGKPVPEARLAVRVDAETGEARRSGKEPAEALLKAVNPASKPGRVLAFYTEQRRSIIEGMAEFGATRSSLQSNLHTLWRDNGIGYTLAADMVDIVLPPGCDDPFKEPPVEGSTTQEERVAEKPKGKPMQDEMLITPLPSKGKRREVALATYGGWTDVAAVAMKLDCSENSVRSHLNDLHIKHGFGFEILGGKARLLVPEGWEPNE